MFPIIFLCSILFFGYCPPAFAEDAYIITVGQNQVFTQCNYHNTWFTPDYLPGYPEPWSGAISSRSEGNEGYVSMQTNPGYAGRNFAEIGVQFQWDLNGYNWEEIKTWPVKVTIELSYAIQAQYILDTGSANAGVIIPGFLDPGQVQGSWGPVPGVNCLDWVGNETNNHGPNSGNMVLTFIKKSDGSVLTLDNLFNKVFVLAHCQSYSIPDTNGNTNSSGQVNITKIKIEFINDVSYYWRGLYRPYIEKKYYDENNPPVFLLRDFEYKTHDYGDANCGIPKRGNLPIVAFGSDVPETNGTIISTELSVKVADKDNNFVEIANYQSSSPYAECSSQFLDVSSSLKKLSGVMERLDLDATMADGVATLTYSYGGNSPVTKNFNFQVKIPRFEGLYIFTQDSNGYWDWEPYQGDLGGFNFIYLLIHGWQTDLYPNIKWMYDMALSMKTQSPDLPVLGWFWQKESYGPGITYIPGGSLFGAAKVAANVAPEAEKLKNALIAKHLNSSVKVHFIGHSFGGFMGTLTLCSLLNFPQGIESAYDGLNFKLTLADVYQFIPTLPASYNFTNRNGFLLSQGLEVENYISCLGRTLDPWIPPNIDKNTYPSLDPDKFNINLKKILNCSPDHGAAIWYYFDNQCWKKAWLPRMKFKYVLKTPQPHIAPLLLFQNNF